MKRFLKSIYTHLPFKKQLFTFLKPLVRNKKSIYQHLHFTGAFRVFLKKGSSFKIMHYGYELENEVFWKGINNGWEKYSVRLWTELCKDSNIILDIGANTGIYALLAKSVNPSSKVIAFEPVERVFDKLEKNVKLNNYDITCVKKAVSNFNGVAKIYDKDTEHTYSVTVNSDTSTDKETSIEVEIATVTLDSFIKEHSLPKIDLIKLDVEMHEVEALEGFKDHLREHQPTLLIEILNNTIAEGVERLISGLDYLYYNIDEDNGIRKVSKLEKSDYYNFLLCSPEVAEKLQTLKESSNL